MDLKTILTDWLKQNYPSLEVVHDKDDAGRIWVVKPLTWPSVGNILCGDDVFVWWTTRISVPGLVADASRDPKHFRAADPECFAKLKPLVDKAVSEIDTLNARASRIMNAKGGRA